MNKELRNFRLKQNKSIKEMSRYLGISASAYEKVEYGQRTPSFNFIKKFKQRYPDCNADALFFADNYTLNV